ncbi:AEC family transporter [Edaphobacter sp. HDX4]|uniref:AEC family transporter n=1 Tax=Edaphobacter sp. HDX4 TaxID=2794064 RepID=UPI002FE52198
MVNTLFRALFPAIFAAALGWVAARAGYVKRDQAQAFGGFVMRFALPCALLAAILNMSVSQMPTVGYMLCMLAGFLGTYIIAVLVGRSLFRNDLSTSALQGLLCAFPSMAFSGVPILTSLEGPRGLIPIIVGNLISSFVLIPVTLILVEVGLRSNAGTSARPFELLQKSIVHSAKEPIVWLPLLGGALKLCNIHLPAGVLQAVNLVGNASAGTGLFVVGIMLYGAKLTFSRELVTNTVLKNIAQPVLFAAVIPFFGIAAISHSRELILTGAIPAATTSSIIALRYQKYVTEATATIVASTLFSVVTIAAAIIMTH